MRTAYVGMVVALCGCACQHRAVPAAPVPADAGWAISSAAPPVASAGSSARLLSMALPGCGAAPRLGTDGSKAAAAATAAASSTHLAFILARSVAGSRAGATKRVAARCHELDSTPMLSLEDPERPLL